MEVVRKICTRRYCFDTFHVCVNGVCAYKNSVSKISDNSVLWLPYKDFPSKVCKLRLQGWCKMVFMCASTLKNHQKLFETIKLHSRMLCKKRISVCEWFDLCRIYKGKPLPSSDGGSMYAVSGQKLWKNLRNFDSYLKNEMGKRAHFIFLAWRARKKTHFAAQKIIFRWWKRNNVDLDDDRYVALALTPPIQGKSSGKKPHKQALPLHK